ncbi:MAG: hypothetical protein ABI406_00855 [Ktedonobacteraceae bacterium]
MQCSACGAEIPPATSVCQNCGLPVARSESGYGTFQKTQPRRKSYSRGKTAILLLLALLMMFSGFGLIYYSTVVRPVQLRVEATQTVQSILTTDVKATTITSTHATGTAGAINNTLATAQAQATAVAVATVTVYHAIYTQATSGIPVLDDSLSTNSSSNWDEYSDGNGGGCQFSGAALHASILLKNYFVACFAQSTNFSNFAFQTQMTILKGDEGGVIFRANNANSNFYYFRVGHDGYYALFLSKGNNLNTTLAEDASPAIKTAPGQTNILTVIARGSNLYLFVNEQFVTSISDNTFTHGAIGVVAGDLSHPTEVAFTHAEIWQL